jgi:hypothetical protein
MTRQRGTSLSEALERRTFASASRSCVPGCTTVAWLPVRVCSSFLTYQVEDTWLHGLLNLLSNTSPSASVLSDPPSSIERMFVCHDHRKPLPRCLVRSASRRANPTEDISSLSAAPRCGARQC